MKVIQCPNGHYYDGDKFSTCPHCNENINLESEEVHQSETLISSGLPVQASPEPVLPHSVTAQPVMPQLVSHQPVSYPPSGEYMQPNMDIGIGLKRKTVENDDTPMTVAYRGETERIVGWLVSIDGPLYGDFIPLYEKENKINDIVIVFDKYTKRFFVDMKQTTTRVDLDSRTLSDNEFLYHHSRIRVNGNTYVLVELIRDGFDWDGKSVVGSRNNKSSFDYSTGKSRSTRWFCNICGEYNNDENIYCLFCGARKGGSI